MYSDLKQLINPVKRLAMRAGDAIMEFYTHTESMKVELKADQTLLTAADICSNEIIIAGLEQLSPSLPIVSEETLPPSYDVRRTWNRFWLIDPLDGTRGFVGHVDEFTVNIALIDHHRAVLGVIYAPAKKLLYFAYVGGGAFRESGGNPAEPITVSKLNWSCPTIIIGRYRYSKRIDTILSQLGEHKLIKMNSSLKFCWVAQGSADIYPGIGLTSEWDSAAGQIILEQAGGIVVDFNSQSLQYNVKPHWRNPPFLAIGDHRELDTCFLYLKREQKSE